MYFKREAPLAEKYSKDRLQMLGGRSQASCVELYSSQVTECLLSGSSVGLPQPPTSAESTRLFSRLHERSQRERDILWFGHMLNIKSLYLSLQCMDVLIRKIVVQKHWQLKGHLSDKHPSFINCKTNSCISQPTWPSPQAWAFLVTPCHLPFLVFMCFTPWTLGMLAH